MLYITEATQEQKNSQLIYFKCTTKEGRQITKCSFSNYTYKRGLISKFYEKGL